VQPATGVLRFTFRVLSSPGAGANRLPNGQTERTFRGFRGFREVHPTARCRAGGQGDHRCLVWVRALEGEVFRVCVREVRCSPGSASAGRDLETMAGGGRASPISAPLVGK
jgi:hypothetical protein